MTGTALGAGGAAQFPALLSLSLPGAARRARGGGPPGRDPGRLRDRCRGCSRVLSDESAACGEPRGARRAAGRPDRAQTRSSCVWGPSVRARGGGALPWVQGAGHVPGREVGPLFPGRAGRVCGARGAAPTAGTGLPERHRVSGGHAILRQSPRWGWHLSHCSRGAVPPPPMGSGPAGRLCELGRARTSNQARRMT